LWERQWNRAHLLYSLSQIRNDLAPVTYEAFELYVISELPVVEIADSAGTVIETQIGARRVSSLPELSSVDGRELKSLSVIGPLSLR
ncbi:hypothetical protein LCGC14_2890910, partial [marine sediment metagenome]